MNTNIPNNRDFYIMWNFLTNNMSGGYSCLFDNDPEDLLDIVQDLAKTNLTNSDLKARIATSCKDLNSNVSIQANMLTWVETFRNLDILQELDRFDRVYGSIPHGIVTPADLKYPARFAMREYTDAPFALWYAGNVNLFNSDKPVGIVGSRSASNAACSQTFNLSKDLASQGVTVVSGGAFGVDTKAHQGALAATDGKTICVQAGGLNNLYPASNQELFFDILAKGGLIVSEATPTSTPARAKFLNRNRLIVTLSDAIIVTTAHIRSGSMNTANHAKAHRIPLGAMPGSVDSFEHDGTNKLIHEGSAKLVRNAIDVLNLF